MDEDDLEVVDSPMQRCVDAGDLDGLLAIVSPDEIAITWHRYMAAPGPRSYDHPDWWAFELFGTRELFQRLDLYRHLLVKLIDHSSDDALGDVAAGPIEDLYFGNNREDDLRWLEQECAANERFRTALAETWIEGSVNDSTLQRLDAAAGRPLPRSFSMSECSPEELAYVTTLRAVDELVPGGMATYHLLENPTPDQQAAVTTFQAAYRALMAANDSTAPES